MTGLLVGANVTGQGAAIAVLVVGLVLLGAAVLAARRTVPPSGG